MCSRCDNLFLNKTDLEYHIRAYHNTPEPFQCYKCDVSFQSHEDLKIHIDASHQTELSLPKPVLTQPEDSVGNFPQYDDDLHQIPQLDGPDDVLVAPPPSLPATTPLSNRIGSNHHICLISCNICNLMFSRKSELNRHLQSHHEVILPDVHCKYCGIAFQSIVLLNTHVVDLHENMHRHLPCVPANHPELDELQHLAQQVIPQ